MGRDDVERKPHQQSRDYNTLNGGWSAGTPSERKDGQPTPEGLHRDGVGWVLVLLVSRVNIAADGRWGRSPRSNRPMRRWWMTSGCSTG